MKIKLVMLFAVTIIAIVFSSCKKDKVVSKTISGIVVNVATKQPVTNMKVVFSAVNDTRHGFYYVGDLWGSYKEEHQATTTDEYGKFQFENIKIHSNPSYYYKIYTSSYSSLHNGHTEYSNDEAYILPNYTGETQELLVCPDLDFIYFKLNPLTPVLNSDSVNVVFNHKYKNLIGNLPYAVTLTNNQIINYDSIPAIQHQPMGWWYLNICKYKSGSIVISKDSLFVDYGSIKSYQLNF